MAQTKIIQRRIRSVKNAKQITKALEVVAASRMRRVVERVEAARQYADSTAGIMQHLAGNPEARLHHFFMEEPDKRWPNLYIIFTSDRGQAGAFNSNIFNLALSRLKEEAVRPKVIVFGRKGARFFAKIHNIDFLGEYEDLADIPDVNVFAPLAEMIEGGIVNDTFGTIYLIYTRFISSLTQKADLTQLLPIKQLSGEVVTNGTVVYETEPEMKDVLDEAVRLYFESRLMKAKVESAASEHAMRMVAMGNANRNASDLIDALTLELNATRQAAITQEIAEITGGAEAIAN